MLGRWGAGLRTYVRGAMSAPTSTSLQAPRGELFTDSGAAAVWAAIGLLSEESKRELLDAFVAEQLIPDLRGSTQQAQVARALASLREAAELLRLDPELADGGAGDEPPHRPATAAGDSDDADAGEPRLSVDAYRRLFTLHGRRLGWPPDGTIRRWLAGSWNDCLRAAGLEITPDGDALVRELGGALTREECLAAVRDYATESGIELPTLTGYLRWARSPKVRRRPGRRPSSQGPFDRLFGDWGAVLVDAGIAQPDAVGGVGRSTSRTVGGRKIYYRSGYGYSEEQLHGALREIAERLGHSPKTSEYKAARDELLADEMAEGKPPRAFPSLSMIQKNYEAWDDALRAAGLEPVDGRHNKVGCGTRRNGRAVTEEMCVSAIREGFLAKGHPYTQTAYSAWRKDQQARDRAERRIRRLPSYDAIWARYGTWEQAVMVAFDCWDPETADGADGDQADAGGAGASGR